MDPAFGNGGPIGQFRVSRGDVYEDAETFMEGWIDFRRQGQPHPVLYANVEERNADVDIPLLWETHDFGDMALGFDEDEDGCLAQLDIWVDLDGWTGIATDGFYLDSLIFCQL